MFVPVLDSEQQPLMPTTPARARRTVRVRPGRASRASSAPGELEFEAAVTRTGASGFLGKGA